MVFGFAVFVWVFVVCVWFLGFWVLLLFVSFVCLFGMRFGVFPDVLCLGVWLVAAFRIYLVCRFTDSLF